jgi:hypothetical protein
LIKLRGLSLASLQKHAMITAFAFAANTTGELASKRHAKAESPSERCGIAALCSAKC